MYTKEDKEAVKRAESTYKTGRREMAELGDQTAWRMHQMMEFDAQEQQIDPERALFLEQTRTLKDTTRLGRKTFGIKTDTEEKRQRNKKIEQARQLTEEATADTMYVYKVIEDINLEEKVDRLKTGEKRRDSIGNVLFRLEQYHFKPEMYYSSNIKANLKEYLWLVRDFKYVYHSVVGTELAGTYWTRIVKLHPVFTCLEKRLQVYCEHNRIHLDGKVLGDDEFATMLTPQDRLEWYNSVKVYNEAQEEEHRAEEQEEEYRAEMFRSLFETGEEDQERVWITSLKEAEEQEESEREDFETEEIDISVWADARKQEQFRRASDIKKELSGKLEQAQENGEDTEELLDELKEILEDEQRLSERKAKEETGMSEAQSQEAVQEIPTLQMTRFMSVSNYSDRMSKSSRDELRDLNYLLMRAGHQAVRKRDKAIAEKVVERVSKYVTGTRYVVGYTRERELLKDAMKSVGNALKSLEKDHGSLEEGPEKEGVRKMIQAMEDIRNYFTEMTNGTLEDVPADAVNYYTRKDIEETGKARGRNRTRLINTFRYWSNQKDTPLFAHEPTINDLKQRLVSNCYMVASVTGLVHQDPGLLKQCIRDNGDGTVTVRLYEWQEVEQEKEAEPDEIDEMEDKETVSATQVTDEAKKNTELDIDFEGEEIAKRELRPVYIRVIKEIPRIAGADALSAGALWMQMIEKACACVGRNGVKGYRSLWYGNGGDFLERLLGVSPERVPMDNQDQLFEDLCLARQKGYVYNAGTRSKVGDGLSTGHAYAVLGAEERDGVKYVWLRNPYSNHSLQYRSDGSRESTKSGVSSDETYGQFYMKLDDFCKDFTNVTRTNVNKAFPAETI
ncbi:MAG: C2 family cysteine protease [Lachnospiraceae bacterium]|nr:C2 family cysteine protease [Lachnospiraceae bacterium]